MTDTRFFIHLGNNDTILAEFTVSAVSQVNENTKNQTATLECEVATDFDSLTVTSSETIQSDEVVFKSDITIQNGATLTVNGTLYGSSLTDNGTLTGNGQLVLDSRNDGNIIDLLRRLDDYGGAFTTSETLTTETPYHEFVPDNLLTESLLVGIEPNPELQTDNITGIWGLIESVTDSRTQSLATDRYTFEVRVLDRYSAYNNHLDVENNLQL